MRYTKRLSGGKVGGNNLKFKYANCNLCDTDRVEPVGRRRGPNGESSLETNIVRCSCCGLLYPNPMPDPDDEKIRKLFFRDPDSYFSDKLNTRRMRKYEKIVSMLDRYKPGKGRLLDIGCGRGELVFVANERGWLATGTEISEPFARYAKERFNITALMGKIDALGLPEESFDAVTLSSVIQYVRDPMGTLRVIKRILKKDGILYLEVSNEDALVFKIGDFFKRMTGKERITTHLSPLFPSFQIYGFNKKSLLEALRRSGFRAFHLRISGVTGAGRVRGCGLANGIINLARKIIVLLGGLTGNGHLIYCLAKNG